MSYNNKKVLIFGGFGFLGLNLIKKLLEEKSQVTVLDINQSPLRYLNKTIDFVKGDISNKKLLEEVIAKNDILFNLAGRSGPANSMEKPLEDLKINVESVLNILQLAREVNPNLKVVYPGSRLEFGKVYNLPVKEDSPMRPTSIYGIHKLTAEKYHTAFFDNYGLKTTVLRISNPYGPHLGMSQGYNILNYFIDLALKGQTIKIFGEGDQKRDYIYVDDLAEVFMKVGLDKKTDGQVYNIGFGQGFKLIDAAKTITRVVGKGKVEKIDWEDNLKKLETGDYISDISKITMDTGWKPKIGIEEGVEKTMSFMEEEFWN